MGVRGKKILITEKASAPTKQLHDLPLLHCMKCSWLVIPTLWSHRSTCPHPDHPSQQPTSHKSMKKVTVPARRIHNTSHQSTSVAACHMREKRWEGDKSEKAHSIVRTSISIDQTKCWQCCSCEYVHADHQHRLMCVATSCAARQPSSTPTIVPGCIQHNQSIIQHPSMSYTQREVVEGG